MKIVTIAKTKVSIMVAALFCLLFVVSCGIDPETIQDAKIDDVVNGNTFVLDNGVTVHINGIKSSNTYCKEQLKVLEGSVVTLKLDSNEPIRTLDSYEDEVWAYVRLEETGEDLTERLLKEAGEDAFDKASCDDRRSEYKKLFKNDPELESTQLCAKMKSASMLVGASDNRDSWIGTAFFIGKDGLALTNNHVLNHQTSACVFLSNSNGDIDRQQAFGIKRIVYTDETYDYTIFYVDLDPTTLERINYLKLAKDEKSFVGGALIGVLGNPAPGNQILTMSYADGSISAIREEMGKIQINAPITHGFSGGPCANRKGQVIGISQSGYANDNANLNFTVDIRLVRNRLDELNLPYAGK